jgi:hypothetical protein
MPHTDWTPPAGFEPPADWTCTSYGNDTCPSWTCDRTDLILFVEYPDGERECAGASQYTLYKSYDDAVNPLLQTEDYDEVLGFIFTRVNA